MTVKATKENWLSVMEVIEEFLDSVGCPTKPKFQILTAAEEIYINIASYAYVDKIGSVDIDFYFDEDKKTFALTFVDGGIPYNPLEKEDADITLSAEERQPGGLGILMVKKSMDDIKYEYSGGKNRLVLIKKCG